jgi:peptidyl-tRNA hydrolase, PTH2 family
MAELGRGYKMVLVVRGELRLSPGKAAVQVAHAAVLLDRSARARLRAVHDRWEAEGGRKIAVVATTLKEMELLERRARAAGIPCVFVQDAGLTEVAPGTRTVLGLGPARSEELDPLTGQLPLL